MGDAKPLRETIHRGIEEANSIAVAADGDEPQAAFLGRGDHRSGMFVIDIDDGRAARRDQFLEQPELGSEISLDGRMIVEMIAREICEGGRRNAQTIEPKLIEPMRRRFDRKMRDAFAGERIERAMQRHRIGRRERTVGFAAGRYDADRADARGRVPERRPDLAREGGDRCLAACAGDGGDGLRLACKNLGRDQGERAPRVAATHERDAGR